MTRVRVRSEKRSQFGHFRCSPYCTTKGLDWSTFKVALWCAFVTAAHHNKHRSCAAFLAMQAGYMPVSTQEDGHPTNAEDHETSYLFHMFDSEGLFTNGSTPLEKITAKWQPG